MKFLSPKSAGSSGGAVRKRTLLRVAAACLFSFFFVAIFATVASAQEATIVGTVTDPSGAAVPNAAITITNIDTGVERSLPTNGDGQYVAPDLHIGRYTVHATAAGFKAEEQKDLVLAVGDRTRIDFKLQVGSAQESVTVEANPVAVQTDTGEVSNVINGQQITQLATNGRSLYSLFALAPGASSIQGSRVGFTPVSGDSNVSINGQRAGHNLQLLDGGENLDRGGSSGSVMPSIDSIAEFRNITSNYSAEYGLNTAATITTVIKSGTKQFHASAWEFFRNDALNARNYFNPAPAKVAELRYNVYGFNLGGQVPLGKSHPTFFFYNQEWRKEDRRRLDEPNGALHFNLRRRFFGEPSGRRSGRQQDGYPVLWTACTVRLPALHGATGALCRPDLQHTASYREARRLAARTQTIQSIPTPPSRPRSLSLPHCNTNMLPFVNSNSAALLVAGGKYGGIFPGPTSGAQFIGGNNSPTTLREEIARVDHQFSPKFSVFGHWVSEQISQTYGTTQWSGDNVPSIADVFGNPSYSAVIHTTYVISPTLLNEASFNYNGNRIHIIPNGLVSAPPDFHF